MPRHVAATRGRSGRPDFRISLRVELRLLPDGTSGDGARGLIGCPATVAAKLRRYEDAGVHELVVDFMDQDHGGVPDVPDMLEQLRRFRLLVGTS